MHQVEGGGYVAEKRVPGGTESGIADFGGGQAGSRESEQESHNIYQELEQPSGGSVPADGGSVLCAAGGRTSEMATEGARQHRKDPGFLGLLQEVCVERQAKGHNEGVQRGDNSRNSQTED